MRSVVKIGVACLTVCMMCVACDKDKTDEEDGANKKNESQFVGQWEFQLREFASGYYQTSYMYYYFLNDGSFMYFYIRGIYTQEKTEGRYSISDGKVYFTERKFYRCSYDQGGKNYLNYHADYPKYEFDREPYEWDDMIAEYQFNSDEDGNYLKITTQKSGTLFGSNYYTLESGDKFRKMK